MLAHYAAIFRDLVQLQNMSSDLMGLVDQFATSPSNSRRHSTDDTAIAAELADIVTSPGPRPPGQALGAWLESIGWVGDRLKDNGPALSSNE